jgi:hypothetical protein
MKRTLIVAAVLALSATAIRAQDVPPPPIDSTLQHLVGHWKMVGLVRGVPVTYDLLAARVLGNDYVELRMTDVARPSHYEARVFIGEDTVANRVIVHWLDSFGAAYSIPPGAGTVTGDTVQFKIPYPGNTFRDTFVYRPPPPVSEQIFPRGSWYFLLESSDKHGGWKIFAEYEVQPIN